MELNPLSDKIQATKNDPRITKIGAFLHENKPRRIPQFLNVFKGEMSIVGPRNAHMLQHTQQYAKIIDSYMWLGISLSLELLVLRKFMGTEVKLKQLVIWKNELN